MENEEEKKVSDRRIPGARIDNSHRKQKVANASAQFDVGILHSIRCSSVQVCVLCMCTVYQQQLFDIDKNMTNQLQSVFK